MKRVFFIIIAAGLSFAFVLGMSETVLALLNFPSEVPLQIVHPQNLNIERKNIEFTHDFQTNSQGLRYPEIPLEKESSEARFLMIGDSYAEGLGVSYKDTFGAVLERLMSDDENRKVRFINGGLTGAGPLQYARLLYHTGFQYQPDKIVLMMHTNDLTDTAPLDEKVLRPEFWLYPKFKVNDRYGLRRLIHGLIPRTYVWMSLLQKKYSQEYPIDVEKLTREVAARKGVSQQKIEQWVQKVPRSLLEASNQGQFNAYLLTHAIIKPDVWVKALDLEGDDADERWATMTYFLEEIVKMSRERGIEVLMVFAPSPLQYDADYGEFQKNLGALIKTSWTQETVLENRLSEWAREHEVPWFNLTPYFRSMDQDTVKKMYYAQDGHWTPEGHLFVASLLRSWLNV